VSARSAGLLEAVPDAMVCSDRDAGWHLAGRRKDGSTFPTEIFLAAAGDGDSLLFTAAVRDISGRHHAGAEPELRRAQADRDLLPRQLQQSQRLESLGQLAGGVAHDFNNLLGVISSYAAFVADEIGTSMPPETVRTASEDLARIQEAADRASRLTRQLLSFARRGAAQPRVLHLSTVIDGLRDLLQRAVGEHIKLRTTCQAGTDVVLADHGQIEQVLVNLAVNARDAMPDGGVPAAAPCSAVLASSAGAIR